MQRILEPLETAGATGVYMARGNGCHHRVHPIFAAFIGNYPEQILSTGSIYGECPTCDVDCRLLGGYDSHSDNQLQDLKSVQKILDSFDEVFYCNVIDCIKSLFGDPNFTSFLRFSPEKHYTDDTKGVQMYHDMHTGKWWWTTQVSSIFNTLVLN
jgi:hypothetical protein